MSKQTNMSPGQVTQTAYDPIKEAVRVTPAGGSLVPENFDYIELDYTGGNLTTVLYKVGGASGVVVATLTLGYSGSNLTSVTRT